MDNTHIIYHHAIVSREMRHQQSGHKSVVVWFTGLSGSGKSTLAHAVESFLYQKKCRAFVLDGDNIRHGLSANLNFSDDDRKENIGRIGEVAKLMMESGVIAITAFISPFRKERNKVRNMLPHGDFIEIYCNASLAVCEKRDVKGLYKKARLGQIKHYTGIDSPYEAPKNPDLSIDTEEKTLEDSVREVVALLKARGVISG